MNSTRLGILSALFASACCVGPIVLAFAGLGGLGLGVFVGRHAWWFLIAAVMMLTMAWCRYAKEVGRCRAASCDMAQGKATLAVLILASAVVALFIWMHL